MRSRRLIPFLLPLAATVILATDDALGVTVYRIGMPFSAAERDSLAGLGVEVREFDWSIGQELDGLEMDSLAAGSLQPNFFSEDEDIAASALIRGGWLGVHNWANVDRLMGLSMIDEDDETSLLFPELNPDVLASETGSARQGAEQITLDMGGRFLIREVRIRPDPDNPEHFLESFTIGVGKKFETVGNSIENFPPIVEIKENTEVDLTITLDAPVVTETVQLRIMRVSIKEVGVASFEVYGGGYVGKAFLESDVIELDDVASLGEMSWSGREDADALVEIRTRAGSDPHPVIFWETRPEQQDSVRFLDGGGDLTLAEYKKSYGRLSGILKPAEDANQVSTDTEHWSFWSSPYAFDNPGAAIVSPGPRRYIQLRADFSSTTDDGGKIDYIEFKASSPPLVRDVLGEIFPIETEVGKLTRFTYFLNPTIPDSDSGFDGIEIFAPSGVSSVDSLRIDAVNHDDFSWSEHESGLGFDLILPRRLGQVDSGALVEVVFTAPVLREVGSVFNGRVFDTSKPLEVRQRVVPGDAAGFVDSEQLSVRTSLSSSLVFSPELSPNPFTPNGDGVNDVMNISYKLLRVTSAVPVSIEFFDLSGRRVRQLYSSEDLLGEYAHTWDGRDDGDVLVAPGLYLYRITAEVQSDQEVESGVVAVAY